MQRLRNIIALADLLFSLSLVSFWWTAVLLLLLRKAFSTFPVKSITLLVGNGRGNILKTSTSISLNFLLHFWITLSRLPRTSVLHFWTVPRVPFLEPSPKTKFQFWPRSLRSDSGTGRVGTPPDSLGSFLEVYTPWDSVLPRRLYKLRG